MFFVLHNPFFSNVILHTLSEKSISGFLTKNLCFEYGIFILLLVLLNLFLNFTEKFRENDTVTPCGGCLFLQIVDFCYLFVMPLENLLDIVFYFVSPSEHFFLLHLFHLLLALLHLTHLRTQKSDQRL